MDVSTTVTNSYSTGNAQGNKRVGGFIGCMYANGAITNSYSTGNVKGNERVGGFIGYVSNGAGSTACTIQNSISYSKVIRNEGSSDTNFGSMYGFVRSGMLSSNTTNNFTLEQNLDFNGANQESYTTEKTEEFFKDSNNWKTLGDGYDYSTSPPTLKNGHYFKNDSIKLCVGSNSGDDTIKLDTKFKLNDIKIDLSTSESSKKAIKEIDKLLDEILAKKGKLAAAANRLESSLDITENNKINWSSSLSVIKDTDIASESINLVQSQILQQVSTSLFASARQDKNTALFLIQKTLNTG